MTKLICLSVDSLQYTDGIFAVSYRITLMYKDQTYVITEEAELHGIPEDTNATSALSQILDLVETLAATKVLEGLANHHDMPVIKF